MQQPIDFHALFVQLQARYPTSRLTAELVQIHANQFLVQATVQVGDVRLVTAMAAAPQLEQAEDAARLRVLSLLGIGTGLTAWPVNGTTAVAPSPTSLSELSTLSPIQPPAVEPAPPPVAPPSVLAQVSAPTPWTAPSEPAPIEPPIASPPLPDLLPELDRPASGLLPDPTPEPELAADPPENDWEAWSEPAPEVEEFSSEAEPLAYTWADEPEFGDRTYEDDPLPSTTATAVADPVPEVGEPEDYSFLIAQTDIEIDRIGWTKRQGSNHLKRTYGKKTRSELTAEQLLDFLNYLKACPSAGNQ